MSDFNMDENLKKKLGQIEKRKQSARDKNYIKKEAELCNDAGKLLAENRLFKLAIQEHNIELQLSERLNDPITIAISHRKLGECLRECEDFEQAIVHHKQYLKLSVESNDQVEVQRALATIGLTYFQSALSGDASEIVNAHDSFLESLGICDKLQNTVTKKELLKMRAGLYLNLGHVYYNLKDQKKGMNFIEKALAITRSHELKDTEFRCHFSLGELKLFEDRPSEALQCFERARKLAQHQRNKFGEADTLVQMGKVLLRLGDFKAAKNILKKCYKKMEHSDLVAELRFSFIESIKGTRLLEKLENNDHDEIQMKTMEDLGDIYSSVKCYTNAVHYYLKQLEMSEKLGKTKQEKAAICFSIAASYLDDKQYEKAKDYFHKELRLRDCEPEEQCDTWCTIAEVSKLAGDGYEVVESAYENALECAGKSKSEKRRKHLRKLVESLRRKSYETDEGISSQESETNEENEPSQEVKKEYADEEGYDGDCRLKGGISSQESETNEENEPCQEVKKECAEEEGHEQEEGAQLILEEMEVPDSDNDDEEQDGAARVKRTSMSINKRNEKGETLLYVAAMNGRYHLAKNSLDKGVSVHSRDYIGWQPLHEACNYGNLNIVELLLDKGADINDPGGPHCRGMTPLHDAAQNGHVKVVKLLITRGASVTQRNKDGDLPLDLVVRSITDNDDDDFNPDLARIRQEMIKILRNATPTIKSRPSKTSELTRRDKLQLSDECDGEQVLGKAENSRKRESASLENRAKVAKVSNGTLLGMGSHVRMGEGSELMHDSENNGTSQDSEGSSQRQYIQVDSDHQSDYDSDDIPLQLLKTRPPLDSDHQSSDDDDIPLQLYKTRPSRDVQETRQRQPRLSDHVVSGRSSLSESWNNCYDTPIDVTVTPPMRLRVKVKDKEFPIPCPSVPGERKKVQWLADQATICYNSASGLKPILSLSTAEGASLSPDDYITDVLSNNMQVVASVKGWNIPPVAERYVEACISANTDAHNEIQTALQSNSQIRPLQYHAQLATVVNAPPMRLRVEVLEKVFLIPCPSVPGERKIVQWLADQAATRFYSVSGWKPILSLYLAGALLSPDDYITDVLSHDEQVVASVEDSNQPPVAERCVEACISANTGVKL